MKLRNVSDILCLVRPVIAVFVLSESSTAGITRTAKRLYMFDIYGGTSMAHGEYEGIGGTTFIDESGATLKIGADYLYDDGTHLGVDYGMMQKRTLFSVGFRLG